MLIEEKEKSQREKKLFKELMRILRKNPELFKQINNIGFRAIHKIDENQKLREKGFEEKLESKFKENLKQLTEAILSRNEKIINEKLNELEKLV
jgi:hypothetical protein